MVKYLRSSAAYHRPIGTPVVVSWSFLVAMKAHGLRLEMPAYGYPGKLTPDQAERYAEQLEARADG